MGIAWEWKHLILVAAALFVSFSFGFELVGEKGCATVVVAADAEESSVLAAQEITNYVARLTGRVLPISTAVPETGAAILIGTRAKFPLPVPKAALSKLDAAKNTESYWIGVAENRMCIVGWEEVAELYGAYRFLEDKLGIRWFVPATEDDPGDYVPPWRATVEIAPYGEFREPSFTERRLDMCGSATQFPAPHAQELFLRNGYQIHTSRRYYPKEKATSNPGIAEFFGPRVPRRRANLGGGHLIFSNVWPPDDAHFKEHPEYFALVDGNRVKGHQYCYSNRDLLNRAADGVIRDLDTYEGLGEYVFALADTMHGACQCPDCVAMATADETKKGIESTRFHTFVNVMAERIYAKWPEANLLYLAYWTYRSLPDPRIRHDPRMPVQYCMHERCYGHDFGDPTCVRNVQRLAEIRKWTKIAPSVFTYEYFSATPCHYRPNELTMAHDLKTYFDIGLRGWKEEAIFEDAYFVGDGAKTPEGRQRCKDTMTSCWQRYWVCGRLSWDISGDPDALLAECESKYYGAAYPAMRKYQELRRRVWHANRNCLGYSTGDQRTPTLLNAAGVKEDLLGFLDEADRLAGDDKVLRFRIARDRRWLTEYWIKPNDKLRALSGKTIHARPVSEAVTVDGDGGETAWIGAFYADDFLLKPNENRRQAPIPPELATSVGVCQDGKNLCFLIAAKEPTPEKMKTDGSRDVRVWADDSIELFLYPPALDNRYYHIAVNPKGVFSDAKSPGEETGWDLGIEAKAKILADRYVIELKVPAKNMHPLVNGETWRVNFARNRTILDALTPRGGNWSLGGCDYMDTTSYRPMTIGGENLVRDGAFEKTDDKGALRNWAIGNGHAKVVDEAGNKVMALNGDVAYTYLLDGGLAQPKQPVEVRYSFRARGSGTLKTYFYSFTDTTNARAKHGYDRKFNPNRPETSFALTPEWKSYTATFTVPANETLGLAFTGCDAKDACIDDIFVTREK